MKLRKEANLYNDGAIEGGLIEAGKKATNYLSMDETGVMIADLAAGQQLPASATGHNVLIDNKAVSIRNGTDVLSSYGDTTIFYKPGSTDIAAEIGGFGLKISDGIIALGSKVSASDVTNSGTYIDSSGNISTSSLLATGGTIGGFDITSSKIFAGDSDTGVIAMQMPTAATSWAFAVGGTSHSDYSDCPFRIHKNGSLYSTKGTIGGWTLNDYMLYSDFTLNGQRYRAFLQSPNGSSRINAFAIQSLTNTSNYLFHIDCDGNVYANSVRVNGNIAISEYTGNAGTSYACFWNNNAIFRVATKATSTSSTGTAFLIANGYYAAGSGSGGTISSTDPAVYLTGGCDTTSRFLGSPCVYNRTYTSSSNQVVVTVNGVLGRYASSSARYKHDIEYLTNEAISVIGGKTKDALEPTKGGVSKEVSRVSDPDSILSIPVVRFKYNQGYITGEGGFDYDKPIVGMIAEDVAAVCPECATFIEDEKGNAVPEGWDLHQLAVRMLYVIQQQQLEINALKEAKARG